MAAADASAQIRVSPQAAETAEAGESDRRTAVELELLDAARALTDFAHLASLERDRIGGGGGAGGGDADGRKWGSRGRRSEKRKRGGSEVDWGKRFGAFQLKSQDSIVNSRKRRKRVKKVVPTKIVKSEQDGESPKAEQHNELHISTPQCSISCGSSGGGRSKHQLTEAEKEAKRVRRILANRESARQTIRRRQAMCDDLAKKAADLALENKSMRQERELIMKEYLLLLDKNNNLKTQIARSLNLEETSTSVTVVPTTSASVKQEPLLVCKTEPVKPFIWPPIQTIQEKPSGHDPAVPRSKPESSDKQGNVPSTHRSVPPLYVMPYPWFFPFGNGFYPRPMDSFSLMNKQKDVPVNPCAEGSAPNLIGNLNGQQSLSSTKTVRDAKSSNNLPDSAIRLSPGEENRSGSYTGGNQTPQFYRSFCPTGVIKCENGFPQGSTCREESGSSTYNHIVNPYPDHLKAHHIYHTKKMVNAAMAAEARKRRKELTRLKNLPRRQLGLHC